jgi:hypothetical protein
MMKSTVPLHPASLQAPVSAPHRATAIDTLWYSGKVQHSRRVRFVQAHAVRFAPSTKAMIDDSDISTSR